MDHIDIFRKRGYGTTNALDLGTCEVRRLALGISTVSCINRSADMLPATWICPIQGIQDHPSRPVAVMVGTQNRDILQQLQGHYFGNGRRRWDRLSGLPYWLYLDLFAILTRWDKVWDVARGTVIHREAVCSDLCASQVLYLSKFRNSKVVSKPLRYSNRLELFIKTPLPTLPFENTFEYIKRL
jgi:hypothetical protein